jgi:hypothetical protein
MSTVSMLTFRPLIRTSCLADPTLRFLRSVFPSTLFFRTICLRRRFSESIGTLVPPRLFRDGLYYLSIIETGRSAFVGA